MFQFERGCTRIVFLIGRWAIKIPTTYSWKLFLSGLLANMQEVAFSKMRESGFCPVVFNIPGGWLLVMQRARPLTELEFDLLDYEKFVHRGTHYIPAENKRDSFGILNGEIVAVDYGS